MASSSIAVAVLVVDGELFARFEDGFERLLALGRLVGEARIITLGREFLPQRMRHAEFTVAPCQSREASPRREAK